jgi:serine/threonine-protein kinase
MIGPCDRLGPFLLTSELGKGGMGRVFLAQRPPDRDEFALKVIRDELSDDPRLVRRFLREARVTASISHEHLVDVLDTGTADGRLYIAMRCVSGMTLERLIQTCSPLTLRAVRRIVADVAGALDALHRAELRHRDVKPSNVMVDDDGHATLMDLGVVTGPALSALTKTGALVGTLAYLAPELIRGTQDASPASDIYSLGCVAFHALAGRAPFGGGIFEVGLGHLDTPPPSVYAVRPDLPPSVDDALALALAKQPERRPPTAAAFAMMLRAASG